VSQLELSVALVTLLCWLCVYSLFKHVSDRTPVENNGCVVYSLLKHFTDSKLVQNKREHAATFMQHAQSLGVHVQQHGPLAGTGVQLGGSIPPQPYDAIGWFNSTPAI